VLKSFSSLTSQWALLLCSLLPMSAWKGRGKSIDRLYASFTKRRGASGRKIAIPVMSHAHVQCRKHTNCKALGRKIPRKVSFLSIDSEHTLNVHFFSFFLLFTSETFPSLSLLGDSGKHSRERGREKEEFSSLCLMWKRSGKQQRKRSNKFMCSSDIVLYNTVIKYLNVNHLNRYVCIQYFHINSESLSLSPLL
jgi:hypothetical protein